MADIIITNNKTNGVVIWEPVYEDDKIIDAGGTTYLAGTILGRITTGGNLTAYAVGASDGSEVPIAVLQDDLVLVAATAVSCRPIISGRVRADQLIVHGNAPGITKAQADQLRDFTIIALGTTQLSELDNQ